MTAGRRDPNSVSSSARRVDGLSDSDSLVGIGARYTYSSGKVPIVMIEVTSRTTVAERHHCLRDWGMLKWVSKVCVWAPDGIEKKANGYAIVRSLEPFPGQAVSGTVVSGMEDAGA